MNFDRFLENGSEVLIFSKGDEGKVEYCKNIIKGVIKDMNCPTDLIVHSSPCSHITYAVLGADGKMYYGTYGRTYISNNFFVTKEDYVEYLYNKMQNNKTKINEIVMENTIISNLIKTVQSDKNDSKKR